MSRLGLYIIVILLLSSELYSQKNREIYGRVIDASNSKPIADCKIIIEDLDFGIQSRTYSDSSGYFAFNLFIGNNIKLSATHINYDGAFYGPRKLPESYTPFYTIKLTKVDYQIDSVLITEEKLNKTLINKGFYQRKSTGFGTFLTSNDIKAKKHQNALSVFRHVSGFKINHNEIYNHRSPGLNSSGKVNIYIDGTLVATEYATGIDIDSFVELDQIEGIEIYKGISEIPLRYAGINKASGIILIWTKK